MANSPNVAGTEYVVSGFLKQVMCNATGLCVLASGDFSSEVVRVGYNATRQSAYIDVRNATQGTVGMAWVWDAPLVLRPGRGLAMRCLVDRSV